MFLSAPCLNAVGRPEQKPCSDLSALVATARNRCCLYVRRVAVVPPNRCLRSVSTNLVQPRPSLRCHSRSSDESDEPEGTSEPAERSMSGISHSSDRALLSGQLCLCGVAILWGSYSPVVRYIYACSGPPSPAALTAVRTVIQAAVLLASDVVLRRKQPGLPQKTKIRRPSSSPVLSRYETIPQPVSDTLYTLSTALQSTSSKLWIAGVELGFWNFCGSTFQALGLQYTTATRGAFLIQATSLLTPIMATLAGEKPSRGVWLGCCCTLTGTVLITLDHSASAMPSHGAQAAATSLGGDSLILAAAFFYSVVPLLALLSQAAAATALSAPEVTIRLGGYARRFAPVRLAASKSIALAIIAVGWLLSIAFLDVIGGKSTDYWPGWDNQSALLAVVWSALGPGALVAFLQPQGQAVVPSAQSQVIYSTVPLWSALLAFKFMPEETMGAVGYAGGAVVILAGVLATR